MSDLYLRAADKAAIVSALNAAGLVHNGKAISTHEASVAMIGTLSKPTGKTLTDAEGIEYPEMQAISGYHCNVRTESHAVIDALVPVTILVTSPSVEWAA